MRITSVTALCCLLSSGGSGLLAHPQSGAKGILKDGLSELKSKSATKRAEAAETLGILGADAAAAVPALMSALKDSDSNVRSAAAEALGKIRAQPAVVIPALIEGFTEKDPEKLTPFVVACAQYVAVKPAAYLPTIRATLKDNSRRFGAALLLAGMGKDAAPALPDVLGLAQDPMAGVRVACAMSLGGIGAPPETSVPLLIKLLKDSDAEVRLAAAEALGDIGLPASAALPDLVAALKDKEDEVRVYASLAITKMPTKAADAIPALVEALQKDEAVKVRANAEYALGLIGVPAAPQLPVLTEALKDKSLLIGTAAGTNIRRVAEALAKEKKTLSVPVLQKAVTDLETALHTMAEASAKSDELKEQLKGIEPGVSEAQYQLKEELKSRSPEAAAAVRTTSPDRHDLAEAKRLIQQAEQTASQIADKDSKVGALEDVARMKAMAGDFEGARLIARTLGTVDSKTVILRKMAIEQAKSGDYSTAIDTLGGIGTAVDKMLAYSALVEELMKLKKADAAQESLSYAELIQMPTDERAIAFLFALGRIYAIAGSPEKTSALAASLKVEGSGGSEIKAVLYTIAKAYNHDLNGARTKFAEIHDPLFRLTALEAIATVQLKAKDYAGAAITGKQLIELSQKTSISPLEERITVAIMQSDNGDREGALATLRPALDEAQKKGQEETIGALAAVLSEIGDVEGAFKLIAPLKQMSDQVSARKAIATARAKTGDLTGALALAPADADALCRVEVLLGASEGILESLHPVPKP